MNVTHIFLSNGQWNWDAIGTIISVISVILAATLVWIKWGSRKKVKNQTEQMKIDRLVNEMDKLVAALYSKIGDHFIFLKEAPGYRISNSAIVQEYLRFWDEIKQTEYLGPDYLRSAIDNYLRNKSGKRGSKLHINTGFTLKCRMCLTDGVKTYVKNQKGGKDGDG